jgi:hypothetical protein
LLDGIENGFFDPGAVRQEASELHKRTVLLRKGDSLDEAWQLFHGSFDQNEKELVKRLVAAFRASVQVVTPSNLDATVRLLKHLGREADARGLIEFYLVERNDPRQFWDLDDYAFSGEVRDEDVISAFAEKLKTFEVNIEPLEIMKRVAARESWGSRDLEALAALSTEVYRRIFKEQRGDQLNFLISGTLKFRRIQNPSREMKVIVEKATAALREIAAESRLNARRVEKFGVELNPGNEGMAAAENDGEQVG